MRRIRFLRMQQILAAVVLTLAGAVLFYFAAWIVLTDILPRIRESGLSLTGSNRILNRDWRGNQLYLLVALYLLAGYGLVRGALALFRRPRRAD